MSSQQNVSVSGIGFWGLLGVAFIVLKLCNVITWSWLWVLAPLWGPIAIFVAVIIIILFFVAIFAFLKAVFGKKKR